jgi:pyruvate,water dikinase
VGHLALRAPQRDIGRIQEAREKEVRAIRLRLKGMRRILFDRLMSSTAHYMKLREGTSLIMSEETYLMRCALMNIASNLLEEARLAEPSDIFFLYHDELRDFLTEKLSDEEAKRCIASRKIEMERDASFNPPEVIRGESPAPDLHTATQEKDFLEGIRGSPGRIQGKARIVLDPMTVSGELGADDILVVPFTDVGWTPLLPGIGGIIAETGGQLSHTSIIAREYGLPAVVSVREATRRIKNGQPVTIDGDKGRVYLRHI